MKSKIFMANAIHLRSARRNNSDIQNAALFVERITGKKLPSKALVVEDTRSEGYVHRTLATSGKYEYVLNLTSNPETMAHELFHLSDCRDLDVLGKRNPDHPILHSVILQSAFLEGRAIYAHKSYDVQTEVLCTESKKIHARDIKNYFASALSGISFGMMFTTDSKVLFGICIGLLLIIAKHYYFEFKRNLGIFLGIKFSKILQKIAEESSIEYAMRTTMDSPPERIMDFLIYRMQEPLQTVKKSSF